MRRSFWMFLEQCLRRIQSSMIFFNDKNLRHLARMLGAQILELDSLENLPRELAETVATSVMDQLILSLPLEMPSGDGWLEPVCRKLAAEKLDEWNRCGKPDSNWRVGSALGTEVDARDRAAAAAVAVAFSFLADRDQLVISLVLFERQPWAEVVRQLGVSCEQDARKEYVRARNRLSDLLDADREIPPYLRNLFAGE